MNQAKHTQQQAAWLPMRPEMPRLASCRLSISALLLTGLAGCASVSPSPAERVGPISTLPSVPLSPRQPIEPPAPHFDGDYRPDALAVGARAKIELRVADDNAYDRAAAAAVPINVEPQTHTVAPGETLYAISREHYGDGKRWKDIAAANPGLRPDALVVGKKLRIP